MKLTLTNFRCYTDRTFELPDTGLILLSGPSGSGKTTLLLALRFAWYGKVTKTPTFGSKSSAVRLEWNPRGTPMIISRSTGPKKLSVEVDGKTYFDTSAQSLIDDVMGPEEIFDRSSHVQQNLMGSVLSLPPAEALRFLRDLSGGESAGEDARSRIREVIRESEGKIANLEGKISGIRSSIPSTPLEEWNEDSFASLSKRRRTLTSETSKSRERLMTTEKELDEAEKARNSSRSVVALTTELEKLRSELDSDDESVTEEEIRMAESELLSELKFRTLASKANALLSSKRESLEETRKALRRGILPSTLELEKEIVTLTERMNAKSIYDARMAEGEKSRTLDLASRAELQKLLGSQKDSFGLTWKGSRKVLVSEIKELLIKSSHSIGGTCPVCSTELSWTDGALVVGSGEPPLDSVIVAGFEKFVATVDGLPFKPPAQTFVFDGVEVEDFSPLLLERTTKVGVSKANASQLETIEVKLAALRPEDDGWPRLSSMVSDIPMLSMLKERARVTRSERTDLELEEEKGKIELAKKRLSITERIGEIEELLKTMPIRLVSEEELARLRVERDDARKNSALVSEEMARVSESLVRMTAARETFELRKTLSSELTKLESELSTEAQKLASANVLIELTKKAELTALARTLSNLNLYAREHLDDLFVDPITVTLSTVTTLKTTGKQKAAMSVAIEYRGISTDDFDILSGGEKQRCSLAFVLGANELASSPILLLDECLNNLDSDTNSAALSSLRTYAEGKLVLVISHEAVEGIFDGVVALE